MTIIYVIEQFIDAKWVGIQTNFFNSHKNKSIPATVDTALSETIHFVLNEDASGASEMTTLINSLSSRHAATIPIREYIAIVFRTLPAPIRWRYVSEKMGTGKGEHKLINMPPEFDLDKMRFVWWDGDYARTPPDERYFKWS